MGNILVAHESHQTAEDEVADVKMTEYTYDHRSRHKGDKPKQGGDAGKIDFYKDNINDLDMRKTAKRVILITLNVILSVAIIGKLLWVSALWSVTEEEFQRLEFTDILYWAGMKLLISVIFILIALIVSWAINTILKISLEWKDLNISKLLLYEGIIYLISSLIFILLLHFMCV